MDASNDWSNWGGSFIDTSYDQPRYDSTLVQDYASAGQAVSTSPSNDNWGGWFQSIASSVVGYAVQRDAIQNGITQRNTAPQSYPVGRIDQAPLSVQRMNPLLLIGAGVAVYLLAVK